MIWRHLVGDEGVKCLRTSLAADCCRPRLRFRATGAKEFFGAITGAVPRAGRSAGHADLSGDWSVAGSLWLSRKLACHGQYWCGHPSD